MPKVHRLLAHPSALPLLAEDPRLVLGGVPAAGHRGADVIGLDRVEAYVDAGASARSGVTMRCAGPARAI